MFHKKYLGKYIFQYNAELENETFPNSNMNIQVSLGTVGKLHL